MLPLAAPKQVTLLTLDTIAVPLNEALTVTTPVCTQFLVSFTVTV